MPTQGFQLDAAAERRLAARLFNRVWELLLQESRTLDEDDQMLHAAHASRPIGELEERQILLADIATVAGQ